MDTGQHPLPVIAAAQPPQGRYNDALRAELQSNRPKSNIVNNKFKVSILHLMLELLEKFCNFVGLINR